MVKSSRASASLAECIIALASVPVINKYPVMSGRPTRRPSRPRSAADAVIAVRRAAAIQSFLATAKLNGIEPSEGLKDTPEKLPTWPNSLLDGLLPLRSAAE